MDTVVSNMKKKILANRNILVAAVIEMRKKDRMKDIGFFIEMLKDSLVVEEWPKHRLPFLHPAHTLWPQRAQIPELNHLSLNLNSELTDHQNSPCLYNIFIIHFN